MQPLDLPANAAGRAVNGLRIHVNGDLIGRHIGRCGASIATTACGKGCAKREKCENLGSHDAVLLQSGQKPGAVDSSDSASLFCAPVARECKG